MDPVKGKQEDEAKAQKGPKKNNKSQVEFSYSSEGGLLYQIMTVSITNTSMIHKEVDRLCFCGFGKKRKKSPLMSTKVIRPQS